MIESSHDAPRAFDIVTNELIDDHLRTGSSIRFGIPTSSMSPILMPGDQVIVRGVTPDHLRLGDILVVRQQGAWIAHRLIRQSIKGGSLFLLKGDNSAEPDNPYSAADLYGVVDTVEHCGRAHSLRTSQAIGWGMVVARLSRLQASLWRVRPDFIKRFLLGICGLFIRVIAPLGKQVVGGNGYSKPAV